MTRPHFVEGIGQHEDNPENILKQCLLKFQRQTFFTRKEKPYASIKLVLTKSTRCDPQVRRPQGDQGDPGGGWKGGRLRRTVKVSLSTLACSTPALP